MDEEFCDYIKLVLPNEENEIIGITKGRENNSRKARIGMSNNTKEETNKNPFLALTHANVEMKVVN